MESIKNSAAELKGNQRTLRCCREVAEDGGGSGGNRDYTERRIGTERRGLKAGGLQGGEFGEINRRRGRKSLDGRERQDSNVPGAKEVGEVAGKLPDEE